MEDLDDLFTDQLNEQIQEQIENAAPVPAPPGLSERIDELRLNGCCDKVSWSRVGGIAYITANRREVHICSLRFDALSGSWIKNDYTHPIFISDLGSAYKGRELAHVSWNPSAFELLVSDVNGRIVIFLIQIAFNRLAVLNLVNIEQDDSLNGLVGLIWFNTKRPIYSAGPAIRADGQWRYPLRQLEIKGPYHPTPNKSAFIAVTRGGTVRLGFQMQAKEDPRYQALKHDLDGFSTSADVLTHASLCPDKDDLLLLAVHTFGKQIRLYSLKIDWHFSKAGDTGVLTPTLSSQHLTTIDPCLAVLDFDYGSPTVEPELMRLDLIPRGMHGRGGAPSNPNVLVTFSYLPDQDEENSGKRSYSILSRWELKEETPTIDSSFSQLASRNPTSVELKPEKVLKKLEDVRIDQVIINIQLLQNNTLLAISTCNGGVDFRDRNLEPLTMDEGPDKVSSLSQIGFSFSSQTPCLHTALSPNAVSKAYFGKDHSVQFFTMQLPAEMLDLGGIATLDKIAAAFVLQNAVAEAPFTGNSTNDDIVMTMSQFMGQLTEEQKVSLHNTFMRDMYRVLGLEDKLIDMRQFEKTIRTGMITRCWSMQSALGNYGDKYKRTMPSKLAWVALNLRHIATAYMMAFNANRPPNGAVAPSAAPPEPDINRPDALELLSTLSSWFCQFTDHTMENLFELNRTLDFPPSTSSSSASSTSFDATALRNRVMELNDPSLICVLCGFTRCLLRYNIRGIRSLAPYTQKALAPSQQGSPLAPYYEALVASFRNLIIPLQFLDGMFSEVESLVQKAYAPLTETQRIECELRMWVHGEIPDVLLPTAKLLLGSFVERIRQAPNAGGAEAALTFKDWSSLGILDDVRSKRWRKEVVYDILAKKELVGRGAHKRDLRIRRCTRCGSITEDVIPPRPPREGPRKDRVGWNFQLLRTCLCGGHFLAERPFGEKARVNGHT